MLAIRGEGMASRWWWDGAEAETCVKEEGVDQTATPAAPRRRALSVANTGF